MERRHVNAIREIVHQARHEKSVHGISWSLCLARNTRRKYLWLVRAQCFLDTDKPRRAFLVWHRFARPASTFVGQEAPSC